MSLLVVIFVMVKMPQRNSNYSGARRIFYLESRATRSASALKHTKTRPSL